MKVFFSSTLLQSWYVHGDMSEQSNTAAIKGMHLQFFLSAQVPVLAFKNLLIIDIPATFF